MLKRSYEILTVDLRMLSVFGAWQYRLGDKGEDPKRCSFTYEQAMMLPLSQKGNTILFEQLSETVGLEYGLSDNPYSSFLFDIMFVDFMPREKEEEMQVCFIPQEEETQACSSENTQKAVITKCKQDAEKWLYMNGFSVTSVPKRDEKTRNRPPKLDNTETETVFFRPFVASASMARKGIMLFVNEEYYAELMRRLTLDFFHYDVDRHRLFMPVGVDKNNPNSPYFNPKYRVSAAKLSAYLGLMLSDGVTVREKETQWEEKYGKKPLVPVLNEETVFVADDLDMDAEPFYKQNGPFVWSIGAESDSQEGVGQLENKQKKQEENQKVFRCGLKSVRKTEDKEKQLGSVNLFDGIGLCDNETFDQLEQLLLQEPVKSGSPKKRRYSALIIRLPWIKGVIVRCDFQKFFADQAKEHFRDLPPTVKDVFKRERRLENIRIIINKSMMKGYKYLHNLEWKSTSKEEPDPWKYYWQKVQEYGISMLIAGRHSRENSRVPMNSQFLSTAGLSDEDIRKLIEKNAVNQHQALYLDENTIKDYFKNMGDELDEASIPEDEDIAFDEGENGDSDWAEDETGRPAADMLTTDTDVVFAMALKKNLDLMKTKYARAAIQSHGRSELMHAMRGRIEVDGDYRLIAPDLLAMLHYLYDRYVSGETFTADGYQLKSAINFPEVKTYRGHGCYYSPGRATPWGKGEEQTDIVALRNPHYALGEGAIVSPLSVEKQKDYDRYFSHLSSLIMLPASAVATMGGADFDGDRAAVVCDPIVVKSVKRAIQQNQEQMTVLLSEKVRYNKRFNAVHEDSSADQNIKEFAGKLDQWLERSLDGEMTTGVWREGYGIPLVFGDSQGAAIDFSCSEPKMEDFLLNSFLDTTKQRIGLLSVEALQYASIAYQTKQPEIKESGFTDDLGKIIDAGEEAEQTETEKNVNEDDDGVVKLSSEEMQRLRECMWNWRMVSLSLECGIEIDRAKTGVSCKSAPLRVSALSFGDEGKRGAQDADDLIGLEDKAFSLMREYDLVQRESKARYKSGKELSEALEKLVDQKKPNIRRESGRIQVKRHNVVNLIPEMCYEAVTKSTAEDSQEKAQKGKPFPSPDGKSLQEFLINGKKSNKELKEGNKNQKEQDRKVEEAISSLAWVSNHERAEKLGSYISEVCGLNGDTSRELTEFLGDREELTESEQGIYLFKELMKYQYWTTQFMKSPRLLEDGVPKTPDMLRRMLLKEAQGDKTLLMRFLCSCNTVHYVSKIEHYVSDMTDYLFLSLAGNDFVQACADGKKYTPLPDNDPYFAKGKQLMRLYQQYKMQTGNQIEMMNRMRERYSYCLRNLQQRFSLSKALSIMKEYSQAYEQTPLAPYIKMNMLRRLYSSLEKKPIREGEEL